MKNTLKAFKHFFMSIPTAADLRFTGWLFLIIAALHIFWSADNYNFEIALGFSILYFIGSAVVSAIDRIGSQINE